MSRVVSKAWSLATNTLISSTLERRFQTIRSLLWWSSSDRPERISYERLENYLRFGYFLLSWQQPIYTLTMCTIFNILFFILFFMDCSILRSMYWSFCVLIISDNFIENIVFKREFLKSHPIDPKVSITIKNLVVMLTKGEQYLKQLYIQRPDTVYVYMAFGFILSLLLFITLFNVVYLYMFVMVLFIGPILLSRYCPRFVTALFESLHFMITEDIKEEDLMPDQNATKDSDNESISSDIYAGFVAECNKMPSHLEVEEEEEEYDEIDGPNKHRYVMDFRKSAHDPNTAITTTDKFCSDMIRKTYEEIINEKKSSINSKNVPQIQNDSSDSDFEIISKDELTIASNNTIDSTKLSLTSSTALIDSELN